MHSFGMLLLTLTTLLAAVYAQYRLPFHSATRRQLWFSRLLLIVLGLSFGWVTSRVYPVTGSTRWLVLLSGFGVVHVPAAFILFIKRLRGERK